MATNPIGPGTENLCANMPRSEAQAIRRQAFAEGRSAGSLVRQAIAEYMERVRESAAAVAHVTAMLVLILGMTTAVVNSVLTHDKHMRPGVRIVRTVRGGRRWDTEAA